MSQFLRKIKRNKKTAYKFGIKLTYHAISLTHDEDYNPSGLVIRWSRGHRQVVSTKAVWTPGSQPNANGQLNGDATFEPPCTVELLVTLYKDPKSEHFEEKDYKFVLEDEGNIEGRKALGVFSINIGQFADMLGSSNEVTMEMKPLVKKISEALVAVTIKSEFLKTGKVGDDDMMSTWSAMTDRADNEMDDEQADLSADLSAGAQLLDSPSSSDLGASRNLRESLSFFELKPTESFYEFLLRNSKDDVIDNQGSLMTVEHFKDTKLIALFFAANSSPQCRLFLTVLDSFYNSLNEVRPRDIEILFVSCDYNDSEMLDFMQDSGVSYPGIKSSSHLAEALKEKFEISKIPEIIVISTQSGGCVDKQGRLKIERCGGNEDCFEVLDHWIAGKEAPVRAELDLHSKISSQLSEDGEHKAKIVSKEEKRRQEKLEKERKKKEEEERRRKEKLDKEEKKRLEREEKKKQRDKDKQDKRTKRTSTNQSAADFDAQDNGNDFENPDLTIPDPPEITASTEEFDNDPKPKLTLFQLAGSGEKKETQPEQEAEKPAKKKEKEESPFKTSTKGNDNQLREARAKIVELEQNNRNLSENSQVMYEAKCQLENDKEDLQEKVIELNHNCEDLSEQVRDLAETRDNLAKENQEKSLLIDNLQDQTLGLKEDLNGARGELDTIRQQYNAAKFKLVEYESDKQAKDEERQQLLATTEIQGWLYKRGVRGVTGKKWRRRYFHMGQGFKLYYYKSSTMQFPQGYIDLEKVKAVEPQSPEKQDKNNACFNIGVDGRVFELLALDVTMRDQWINAVNFLVEYRSKYKVDVRTLSGSRVRDTPSDTAADEIQPAN